MSLTAMPISPMKDRPSCSMRESRIRSAVSTVAGTAGAGARRGGDASVCVHTAAGRTRGFAGTSAEPAWGKQTETRARRERAENKAVWGQRGQELKKGGDMSGRCRWADDV